jgi:uroporphyrinogen decarboxylase
MYGHPDAWHRLCDLLATVIAEYLVAQVDAGVDAVQVFDSWVGALDENDYREFAAPHTARLFEAVGGRVPTIHFGTATATILGEMRKAGGDVIGVDWRIPLDEAWARIGSDRAVQGNLDPTLLLGPTTRLLEQTQDVITRASGRPGHIFNLGHGILPSTPLEHVQMLAQYVHRATRAGQATRGEPWDA